MKLMVIGAGLMGRAAACDMARATRVEAVTLVDIDGRRAAEAAEAANRMAGARKVVTAAGDAADPRSMARLMAVENPMQYSVLRTSLSIVFGMATIFTPSRSSVAA